MTDTQAAVTRSNRKGDPCPPWCFTDHDQPLIPGKPEHGHMDGHAGQRADFPGSGGRFLDGVAVTTYRVPDPGSEVRVVLSRVSGLGPVHVPAAHAGRLADLVGELAMMAPQDIHAIAGAIREAGAVTAQAAL